jgi:hypothetical protein
VYCAASDPFNGSFSTWIKQLKNNRLATWQQQEGVLSPDAKTFD